MPYEHRQAAKANPTRLSPPYFTVLIKPMEPQNVNTEGCVLSSRNPYFPVRFCSLTCSETRHVGSICLTRAVYERFASSRIYQALLGGSFAANPSCERRASSIALQTHATPRESCEGGSDRPPHGMPQLWCFPQPQRALHRSSTHAR